jgi:uncharacterized protein (DUF433 family)
MPSNYEEHEIINSLSSPAYTIAFTSRLTGITRWSVSRYLRGYEYVLDKKKKNRTYKPPIVNQSEEDSTYASFLDLIDLLYVKEFLNRDFTLQYLRLALAEAKHHLGSPHFARSEFYTSSEQIILKLPKDGALIALMTGGQLAIPEIAKKLSKKLDFETATGYNFARRWYPYGKNVPIVIDPQIAFGKPIVAGYSVATSNIYDLYLGENKNYKTVSRWFDIPVPEIKTAVQFEHSLWN